MTPEGEAPIVPPPPPPPLDRRRLVRRAAIVAVGAFLFGYLVMAFIVFGGGSGAEVVTVPDVRTFALQTAQRTLERLDLQMEIADSLPNARVPAGGVVAQTPLPGQEVPPRTPVRVILSQGAGRRIVPDVDTYPAEHAERILSAYGFTVQIQTIEDLRAEGRVVGTEPEAGVSVEMPASVRLLVSSGPPLVEVPLVVGLVEPEAHSALAARGLRVGQVQYELRPDVRDGLVLAQVPVPRDSIRAGREVRLYVATHRRPEVPGAPESEDDPDGEEAASGQSEEQ